MQRVKTSMGPVFEIFILFVIIFVLYHFKKFIFMSGRLDR